MQVGEGQISGWPLHQLPACPGMSLRRAAPTSERKQPSKTCKPKQIKECRSQLNDDPDPPQPRVLHHAGHVQLAELLLLGVRRAPQVRAPAFHLKRKAVRSERSVVVLLAGPAVAGAVAG